MPMGNVMPSLMIVEGLVDPFGYSVTLMDPRLVTHRLPAPSIAQNPGVWRPSVIV
jgi:hypothetical protein